jgi:hypothetical protein
MKKDVPLHKNKAILDEVRGTKFEQVVQIFRLIRSKDVFETFFT